MPGRLSEFDFFRAVFQFVWEVSRSSRNTKQNMEDYNNLNHTKWQRKNHIVFMPEYVPERF